MQTGNAVTTDPQSEPHPRALRPDFNSHYFLMRPNGNSRNHAILLTSNPGCRRHAGFKPTNQKRHARQRKQEKNDRKKLLIHRLMRRLIFTDTSQSL